MNHFVVAALYQFVDLLDYKALKEPLLICCQEHGVMGTLLLATEGINGTIAGTREGIDAVLTHLHSDPRFKNLEHKESYAKAMPFYRLKVRLKREIVTMGVKDINPNTMAGTYVKAADWNKLISDPDVVVIDTRNDYEVEIGTFKGAVNPNIKSFRELPDWVSKQQSLGKKPKVAMFCTGGIRCEKSTAFMRTQGFDEVYHLQGGILKYLEVVPEKDSLWEGECFVFDERVAVGHGLKLGNHELCRSCRYPIRDADRVSPHFVEGVSCPRCFNQKSDEKKASLLERQKQMRLAKQRNQVHMGAKMPSKKKSP